MRHAIPTRHSGTAFRSRLEARWATFFDLAGWRWVYKPLDMKGWIPDFILVGTQGPVLVEVKPICWTGDDVEMTQLVRRQSDLDKITKLISEQNAKEQAADSSVGCGERMCDPDCDALPEILVLGAYPHYRPDAHGFFDVWIGVFLRECWGTAEDAACLGRGYKPRRFDFHAHNGSYQYRMGGEGGGDHHLQPVNVRDLECAWREAGNAVQWRAQG